MARPPLPSGMEVPGHRQECLCHTGFVPRQTLPDTCVDVVEADYGTPFKLGSRESGAAQTLRSALSGYLIRFSRMNPSIAVRICLTRAGSLTP